MLQGNGDVCGHLGPWESVYFQGSRTRFCWELSLDKVTIQHRARREGPYVSLGFSLRNLHSNAFHSMIVRCLSIMVVGPFD